MTDSAADRISGAEEIPTGIAPGLTSAPTSPVPTPSEPGSSAGSSSSSSSAKSDLLQKIKDLKDTQQALKEQKKKCAQDMKNALKRKKRLQGQASQLSDADLVEVLRMRKAKKECVTTAPDTQSADDPSANSWKGCARQDVLKQGHVLGFLGFCKSMYELFLIAAFMCGPCRNFRLPSMLWCEICESVHWELYASLCLPDGG